MAQALTPWQRPGPGGGPPPGPQGPPGPPAAGQPPSGQQGGFGPATPATQEPTAPQGGLRTPSVLPPQFATLGSNIHNPIPVGQAGGFGPYRPAQAAAPTPGGIKPEPGLPPVQPASWRQSEVEKDIYSGPQQAAATGPVGPRTTLREGVIQRALYPPAQRPPAVPADAPVSRVSQNPPQGVPAPAGSAWYFAERFKPTA